MEAIPLLIAGGAAALAVIALGLVLQRRLKCASCGAPPPMLRMPKSTQEALWGGWTCPKCGTSLDRTGAVRKP